MMMMMTMVFVTVFVGYQNTLLTSCSMYCTQCCSASRHWHTQFRPRLVILAAWGVVLARHPRKYPVQAGNHKASLSAVQGSWVPGRVVDCSTPESDIPSRRHLRSATRYHLTVHHVTSWALSVVGPSLLQVRQSETRYRTVSVTRRSETTALNNCWKRTYFNAATQHAQRSRDASCLCAIEIDYWHWH